jgi:hypothetical protein
LRSSYVCWMNLRSSRRSWSMPGNSSTDTFGVSHAAEEALIRVARAQVRAARGNKPVRESGSGQNFRRQKRSSQPTRLNVAARVFLQEPRPVSPRYGRGFNLHRPPTDGAACVSLAPSVRWKTNSCMCLWRYAAYEPQGLQLVPALMATPVGWLGSPRRPKPELVSYSASSWHHTSIGTNRFTPER